MKLMQTSSTASTLPMYAPLQQATALGIQQHKHGTNESFKPKACINCLQDFPFKRCSLGPCFL